MRAGDPLRQLHAPALILGDGRALAVIGGADEAARDDFAKVANAAADVDRAVAQVFMFCYGHRLGALRPVLLELLQLGIERLHPFLSGGKLWILVGIFFLLRLQLCEFLHGHKHHGIGGDMAFGAFVADHHVALATGFEAELPQADEPPIQRRQGGLVHGDVFLTIGVQDMHWRILGAAHGADVGQPHVVASGLGDLGHEGQGLLTLALVAIVQIAFADVGRVFDGVRPLADLPGLAVIDHDAGQLADFHWAGFAVLGFALGSEFFQHLFRGRDLLFHAGHAGLVLLHRRLLLAVQGQRRIDPVRNVLFGIADDLGAAQNAGQRVVVACWDRVELVIVAAGAADAHAQQGLANHIQLLVHDVHAQQALVLLFVVGWAQHQQTGGNELPAALRGGVVGQQVARDLLGDELVQRHVIAHGFDDVIAIPPGILERQCAATAGGLREAGGIQPVLRPALGEGVRGHQGCCIQALAVEGRGGKAGQIIGQPALEDLAARIGCRLQAFLLQLGQNEAVDVIAWPRGVLHYRGRGCLHGLKGPVRVGSSLGASLGLACIRQGAGIVRALGNPLRQHCHIRRV